MIEQNIVKKERFNQLRKTAISQLDTLNSKDFIKSLKRLSDKTYPDEERKLKDK